LRWERGKGFSAEDQLGEGGGGDEQLHAPQSITKGGLINPKLFREGGLLNSVVAAIQGGKGCQTYRPSFLLTQGGKSANSPSKKDEFHPGRKRKKGKGNLSHNPLAGVTGGVGSRSI